MDKGTITGYRSIEDEGKPAIEFQRVNQDPLILTTASVVRTSIEEEKAAGRPTGVLQLALSQRFHKDHDALTP